MMSDNFDMDQVPDMLDVANTEYNEHAEHNAWRNHYNVNDVFMGVDMGTQCHRTA